MKIAEDTWSRLSSLLKARLLAKYDPGIIVPDAGDISSKLDIPHRGFYLNIYDSSNEQIARVGFLEKGCTNILESAMQALEGMYTELEAKNIPHKKLLTGVYNFVIVWDLMFLSHSLEWDINTDGIYLNWGDRYKGLYLPYEIKKMSVTKVETLNRLCSWEVGIPSNLWRLPECMCWKILADSYSIK